MACHDLAEPASSIHCSVSIQDLLVLNSTCGRAGIFMAAGSFLCPVTWWTRPDLYARSPGTTRRAGQHELGPSIRKRHELCVGAGRCLPDQSFQRRIADLELAVSHLRRRSFHIRHSISRANSTAHSIDTPSDCHLFLMWAAMLLAAPGQLAREGAGSSSSINLQHRRPPDIRPGAARCGI